MPTVLQSPVFVVGKIHDAWTVGHLILHSVFVVCSKAEEIRHGIETVLIDNNLQIGCITIFVMSHDWDLHL